MLKRVLITLMMVLCTLLLAAQTTGASGTVVDSETGETLPAVQVYFVDAAGAATTYGTTTDMDGNFRVSNTRGYNELRIQMMGYKTGVVKLRAGKMRERMTIKLEPESYMMAEFVVRPPKGKDRYKRKGNPAVELIRQVIAHKDSAYVRQAPFYTADSYSRISFALDNFHPDFRKGFWKPFSFAEKYIDTTGAGDALTISIRENLANEYYQRSPRKEKRIIRKKRVFGVEDMIGSATVQKNIGSLLNDIDLMNDNVTLLYNRFVSPLSSSLAVSYYKYYIQDTILLDGDSCIDLAFVPVNSESYSFTGHLYILNDSTFKLKRYHLSVPKDINLNFVSHYEVEQNYRVLDNGLWAPERANTTASFYIANRKHSITARQTKLYTGWDLQTPPDPNNLSSMAPDEVVSDNTDSVQRLESSKWEALRPEPLTFYESSVYDLVQECLATPKFNRLVMFGNAMTTQYLPTKDANHLDDSYFDFGPLADMVSWNVQEGVRLRVGGITTANLHPRWFVSGYAAFGCKDLRPKFNVTLLHSFTPKKYQPYEHLLNHMSLTLQHDVEEPGQLIGVVDRDNILMSIPLSKEAVTTMKNYQYVSHIKLDYMREWQNKMTLHTTFDFTHNAAAGALRYNRIQAIDDHGQALMTHLVPHYNDYNLTAELRYTPGAFAPIDRMGQESTFNMEQDAPLIRLIHHIGYLDDRYSGGEGFFYNHTDITAEKRFWFSSFGHLDARIQAGIIWNRVPFTKLYIPQTSTSVFLAQNAFNQMQPMEFLMDKYVSLYATYYFKGWILNRIPGINKLKLRGVVSFSGIYGGLSDKNNPYKQEHGVGLYEFPNTAVYDADGNYQSGYTSSPIDYHMPYMEVTAGFENIFKFIRIDYVRRLTYNDYLLPDGVHHRRIGAWGRNGVKVSIRFAI